MENVAATKSEETHTVDFSLKIYDAQYFKRILEALNSVIDEATFKIDAESLSFKSMDKSHVSMMSLTIPRSSFDEYDVKESTELKVSIPDLLKLIKKADKDEILTVERRSDKTVLKLHGKFETEFTISELDLEEEETPEPKISFNSRVRITTDSLYNAVKRASEISDVLTFKVSSEGLQIQAKSDLTTTTIKFDRDNETILGLEGDAQAAYSANYIVDAAFRFKQISDIISLELSDNMPLKATLEMAHMERLTYYVAPRITQEE